MDFLLCNSKQQYSFSSFFFQSNNILFHPFSLLFFNFTYILAHIQIKNFSLFHFSLLTMPDKWRKIQFFFLKLCLGLKYFWNILYIYEVKLTNFYTSDAVKCHWLIANIKIQTHQTYTLLSWQIS